MVDPRLTALYVGPDQVMPVMSILASVVGALLIFWQKLASIARKLLRLAPPPATSENKGGAQEAPKSGEPRKQDDATGPR